MQEEGCKRQKKEKNLKSKNMEPHHLLIKGFARTRSLGDDMNSYECSDIVGAHPTAIFSLIPSKSIECVYWNERCLKTYPF